jgi:hypothetical protein
MRAVLLVVAAGVLCALLAGLWLFLGADSADVLAREQALGAGGAQSGTALVEQGGETNETRGEEAARLAAAAPTENAAAEDADAVPASASVVGRILGADGQPLAGASVRAAGASRWDAPIPLDIELDALPPGRLEIEQTVSAADGTYRFEGLPKGGLRVAVRASGHAPRYEERWVVKGEPEQKLPDIALAPGVFLAGRVVDRAGTGVANATILLALDHGAVAGNLSMPGRGIPLATTGADGAFALDSVAPGPWHLFVEAAGFRLREERGRTARAGERVSNLVIALEPGLEIRGSVRGDGALPDTLRVTARTVRASLQGNPSGADENEDDNADRPVDQVRARHATCDAAGEFVLAGLAPNVDYRLSLSVAGSEPGRWKRVNAVQPVTARAGQRGIELVWKPESALVLRVVDAETRAPLEALEVWAGYGRERALRDDQGEVLTKFADGRVRYGELRSQPGKAVPAVWLRVRAPGYRDHEAKNLALASGETKDLGEIALVREKKLTVRVLERATSKPVPGARVVVSLEGPDGVNSAHDEDAKSDATGDTSTWAARSDAHGVAVLSGAPEKNVNIGASAKGFLPSTPVAQLLPADADATAEVLLDRGGTIRVRVVDASGKPVPGVGIAHRMPGATEMDEGDWISLSAELETDPTGVARFAPLALGVHGFCLHDSSGQVWLDVNDNTQQRPAWIERSVTEGSDAEITFVAPPRGAIQGRIRENTVPLEGAQLKLSVVREGEGGEQEGWSGPNDPLATVTDHEGRYRYENLRCGEYWLSVHHGSRRMSARMRVSVREDPRTFDFDLDVATIEGTITDIEGRPLGGIEVNVFDTSGGDGDDAPYQLVVSEDERGNQHTDYRSGTRSSERTDARGHYVLRGLATGAPLVVHVESDIVEAASSPEITLSPDEVKTGIDFRLRRAGIIDVTLAQDPPQRDMWFEVRALRLTEGGEAFVQSTWLGSWNKHASIRGLAPGRYKVVLTQPHVRDGQGAATPAATQEVEVKEQETTRVSFAPW